MRLPRISIKTLMAFVVLVAVGLAALARPNEGWAVVLSTSAFTALLTSLLGIIFRRGPERAGWVGFAIFGWSFFALLLSFSPWPSHFELGYASGWILGYLQVTLFAITMLDGEKVGKIVDLLGDEDDKTRGCVAFSLMDLMFALLGARIARAFARRECPGEM
jgi:hypothetical protein